MKHNPSLAHLQLLLEMPPLNAEHPFQEGRLPPPATCIPHSLLVLTTTIIDCPEGVTPHIQRTLRYVTVSSSKRLQGLGMVLNIWWQLSFLFSHPSSYPTLIHSFLSPAISLTSPSLLLFPFLISPPITLRTPVPFLPNPLPIPHKGVWGKLWAPSRSRESPAAR